MVVIRMDQSWLYADDATMRTLRKMFVLTPAMRVAVVPSEEQPTTNLIYVMNSTNAYI
jgi:hypothetical protein